MPKRPQKRARNGAEPAQISRLPSARLPAAPIALVFSIVIGRMFKCTRSEGKYRAMLPSQRFVGTQMDRSTKATLWIAFIVLSGYLVWFFL
jgi:hypothetical protein